MFLNKTDQFEDKVKSGVHIADFITAYTGPKFDVVKGRDFFRSLYIDAREEAYSESGQISPTTPFFIHFTCATDTRTIQNIFDSVKATLFCANLENMAM